MLNDTRDVEILKALVRYYVLNRPQIQRLFFPSRQGDRIARRRLQTLLAARLISRTQVEVVLPGSGSTAPVYLPSARGTQFLAEFCDDDSYLLAPSSTPNPQRLLHWLAISDFHLTLDAALQGQADVACLDWLSEWDVANKDEHDPDKRYRLYTLIQDKPRLVCAPDAAFLLSVFGHTKPHYLEMDRATSGSRQIAASKTPGYAALMEQSLQRRHFPHATVPGFVVLSVSPTAKRRDAVAKAVVDKPGAPLWRFAATPDLTPDRFLFDPVWHRCDGQAVPLIKRGGSS